MEPGNKTSEYRAMKQGQFIAALLFILGLGVEVYSVIKERDFTLFSVGLVVSGAVMFSWVTSAYAKSRGVVKAMEERQPDEHHHVHHHAAPKMEHRIL